MAVVQSASGLVAVARPAATIVGTTLVTSQLALYEGLRVTYEDMYATQPELRSAIDFLARNIAQLPLHAYERVSDTERRRITGTPLTATLDRPDTNATRSRWLDALVKDLALFDAAYFVKVRGESGRVALVRVPPPAVELTGSNWLKPEGYRVRGSSGYIDFTPDQIIDIHGYNPADMRQGLSAVETLRRVLAEQAAAGQYRERFWENSARMGGVIERPPTAPNWSDSARARFRAEFDSTYTGAAASGRTLVLEEGMTYRPVSSSMRDAQWLEAFQLSREMVAAAYGIPVGLLGLGATNYASLTEQHRQLYADCLAPWLIRIQEELELQLLPEFAVSDDTYLEFNLGAKLAGSFTEQAAVLQAAVGAPYLSRNEARARLNLPPVEAGDDLVTPLNVLLGGQASPQDSVSDERILEGAGAAAAPTVEAKTAPDQRKVLRMRRIARERKLATDDFADAMKELVERQRRSVTAKLGAKAKSSTKAGADDVFSVERFTEELTADLKPLVRKAASRMALTVGEWDVEEAAEYLDGVAAGAAEAFNAATYEALDELLEDDELAEDIVEEVDELFDGIGGVRALLLAGSLVATVGEFSRAAAAVAADIPQKTWVVTSGNPRSEHAAMDGETVDRGESFSNGAMFPGDPALEVSERANCECLIDWGV